MTRVCLIGDIGATYARFAIAASDQKIEGMRVYKTSAHNSLLDAIHHYLDEPTLANLPRPTKVALAVAAPLSGDHVTMMNKPWSFSLRRLEADLGLKVDLYNDFSA